MLCLPEFDTYHILPEYAREPDNARNIVALHVLKHRARIQLQWRVLTCRLSTPKTMDALMNFQMGHIEAKEPGVSIEKPVDFSTMTEEEMMTVYNMALKKVGLTLDPEALLKAQQQGG